MDDSTSPPKSRAANSSITAVEEGYREDLKQCYAMLKRHPQSRNPVFRFMSKNKWGLKDPVIEVAKSRATKGKEKSAATKKQKAEENKKEREEVGKVPSSYNRLGAMRFAYLSKRVLPALDASAWSVANINASWPSLSAVEKQQELLKLIEYVSGKTESFQIVGDLLDFEKFIAELKSCIAVRGRTVCTVRIPVDWEKIGVYEVAKVTKTGDIHVTHKFTKSVVKVNVSEFEPPPKEHNFIIRRNWSEKTAELVVDDDKYGGKAIEIGGLFTNHDVTRKRRAMRAEEPSPKSSPPSKRSRGSPAASSV